ncbi:MAG: hypothetical protein WCH99_01370 [Verrucomicrobiota bacterium]
MPIRINLLAEALEEEEMRRRDPVKRAIYVGVLLAVLALVWWSTTLVDFMLTRSGYNQIQAEIRSRTNEYNMVQMSQKKIDDAQNRLSGLQKYNASRFLQGTMLNALQQVYVPNVQMVRLRLEQNYTLNPGIAAKTNSFGIVAGHPATATERKILTIEARDFSASPGEQVNTFKNSLALQPYFNTNLIPTNGLRLSSLTPLQTGPDIRPYVIFSVECRFIDKTP